MSAITVESKSQLGLFCERVSKLEDVYVAAYEGPNRAKREQAWRLPEHEMGEHASMFRACLEMLEAQPPAYPQVWIECQKGGTGAKLDGVTLQVRSPAAEQVESDSAIAALTQGVLAMSKDAREMNREAWMELRQAQHRIAELSAEVAQLAILVQLDSEPEPDRMTQAMEVFGPLAKVVAVKMLAAKKTPGLPGPTEAPSPTVERTVAAMPDTFDAWGDEHADALVDLLVAMVSERPDLLNGDRIGRLAEAIPEDKMAELFGL